MPIYEYKCEKCGHVFEKLLSFSDRKKPVACPKCDTEDAKRQVSGFAVGGSGGSRTACATPT